MLIDYIRIQTGVIQCALTNRYCFVLRIVREDGVGGLFRGAIPTATRAMALNMGMLASNDQVRLLPPSCPHTSMNPTWLKNKITCLSRI